MEDLKLRVGSVIVDVVTAKFGDESQFGEAELHPSAVIKIDDRVVRSREQALTLIHELLHIISELYGLGLTEQQVLILEQALTAVAIDNQKECREWLLAVQGLKMPYSAFK